MEDPLWRCMDSAKTLTRDQLELVIQRKKITEVYRWFEDHFSKSSHKEYAQRCPIVIIQGPTGCGKTSTLKWISNELKISIKEFSETTDLTAVNYSISKSFKNEDNENLSSSIDRRKAFKFENFVYNSVMYNALYPTKDVTISQADSEFDSDDEIIPIMSSSVNQRPPHNFGVIIHIDTSLTFIKTQRTLFQTLIRLIKLIKDTARKSARRVAVVFESLDGENETISLPTKLKLRLGIQVFKFNPIIKTNMKKLIESLMRYYSHIVLDKETIDQLVSDCDGDIRACINTLQLICNRSTSITPLNGLNNNALNICTNMSSFYLPVNKRQKLNHDKVRNAKLHPSLMRDNTRSLGFFHVLGKIFYQKRLYPEVNYRTFAYKRTNHRPYPTENTTEYLANMVDVDPKNLIIWLHQHYYKFCLDSNIEKAALFMENLSTVDATSMSSTQSSQFYEAHSALDQLQIHLAIESTVFSLYEDQSASTRQSYKKIQTEKGSKLIKSSVDIHSSNGELYSFNKPTVMSLHKLVEDYGVLLEHSTSILMESGSVCVDPNKALLDYIPYLTQMSNLWNAMSPDQKSKIRADISRLIEEENAVQVFRALERLDSKQDQDFELRHDSLLEMIEELEVRHPQVFYM